MAIVNPLPMARIRAAAQSSVRVVADEVVSWMLASRGNESHGEFDDFGPLRVPFGSLWIEWSQPRPWRRETAVWVTASDATVEQRREGIAQVIGFMMFQCHPNRSVGAYPPATHYFCVDGFGKVLWASSAPYPADDIVEELRSSLHPAYVAIGLMNCRNVVVTECVAARTRTPSKSKGGKVRARPPLPYHTIALPNKYRPRNGSQARVAAGDPESLPIVRGHFKTYTEDAPLLGKHVGTYWWHPRLKDTNESGPVNTGYRIGRPTAAAQSAIPFRRLPLLGHQE